MSTDVRPLLLQAVFLPDPLLPARGRIALYDLAGAPPAPDAVAALGFPDTEPAKARLALPGGDGRPEIVEVPVAAVPLEAALPAVALVPADASDSLRAWGAVASAALRLVAARQVLPVLGRSDDQVVGGWAVADPAAALLDRLAAALPVAGFALAAPGDAEEVWRPEALVRACADAVADLAVRRGNAQPRPGRPRARLLPWTARWAEALVDDADPSVPVRDADELVAGIAAWSAGGETRVRPSGAPELALRAPDTPDGPWWLDLGVRTDRGEAVPAATVWADAARGEGEALAPTLLRGLVRAARVFPPLDAVLDDAAPEGLDLTVDQAWDLLQVTDRLLSEGVGVLLPPEVAHTDLAVRVRVGEPVAEPDPAPLEQPDDEEPGEGRGAFAGLLTGFRWEIALGGEALNGDEFAQLVATKAPLVRIRDRWVRVDPERRARLQRFEHRRSSGHLPLAEALALGLAGSEQGDFGAAEDETVDVVLDGGLADLADRIRSASDRPPPPATPPGFNGELRPYQQRGVAWLAGMGELGLGGVLADDMGLGKCSSGETLIFANGALQRAEHLWGQYAAELEPDEDGGEWASPKRPLMINALRNRHICATAVRRLYRQHIDEPLRRIRLDDGSAITITRRHKLFGIDGWTNRIAAGDRIAVPSRLRWQGAPLDHRFVRFLAWQIAEGHEGRQGMLRLTQKDEAVLVSLQTDLLSWAGDEGLELRLHLRQHTGGRAAFLMLTSKAYRERLAQLGYVWGHLSASKRIPDPVVSADDDTLRVFLRAYFSAEGSVIQGMRCVEIASASPLLMRQLSTMLRRFGIWLRITTKHKAATNGSGIERPYDVGLIGGPSLRRFHEHIGFEDDRKQAKLAALASIIANTNTEGIPSRDLLAAARELSRLPMSELGAQSVYFAGNQDVSRELGRSVVATFGRLLDGTALTAYQARPPTRWTAGTLAAYRGLERRTLADLRRRLAHRVEPEIWWARVVEVEDIDYEGYVYDFEVPADHNYVAGGMLAHNTVEHIAYLLTLPAGSGPHLIVCPTSVVGNWERELARFAPSVAVTRRHGPERAASLEGVEGVVVTSYGTLRRDVEVLERVRWDVVALDEAQQVKNPLTAAARAVRRLRSRQTIALTGTPLENRLAELWSLFDATNPGLLGSRARFGRRFVAPIEQRGDAEAARRLRRLVAPFILRREKGDPAVIADLPDKVERDVVCTLTPEQAALYQAAVDRVLGAGLSDSSAIERRGRILALLTELKQICNHPAHYLREQARAGALLGRSGKLEVARDLVAEAVGGGAQVLVFTQFVEMGRLLAEVLGADLGREVPFLHGAVSATGRDRMVAAFQGEPEAAAELGADDAPPVLLVSLRAGGTGLNLTAATHVIHYDRWWNPAVEDQATDRAHRIGQSATVHVHKLVTAGTVEERIAQLLDRKRDLAEQIVGSGETWVTELGDRELAELVALSTDAVVTDAEEYDVA